MADCLAVSMPSGKRLSPLARAITIGMWLIAAAVLAFALLDTCGRP